MYISRPRIHKSDSHAAGARRLENTLSHVHIASGFLFMSSVDSRGRHRHQYPPPKEKTPLSTEKYPTSLPINAPLSSARIRPETQHLPTHETRCGTGSTAGHLHPAPPTWRLMRQNSRPLAHRGGGPSPRRPSADRAVPCSARLRVKPTELSVRWMGRRCCSLKFDLILGSLINGRFFVCLSALLMGERCHSSRSRN